MDHLTRFTSDSAALEKLLRVIQFVALIITVTPYSPPTIKTFLILRNQLALARRYFRFFRFLPAFRDATRVLRGVDGESQAMKIVLEVGKFGFNGVYLGMESASILHVMGIYLAPEFALFCQVEGNKFWFYSLLCSITLHLLTLFTPDYPPPPPHKSPASSPKRFSSKKVIEHQKALKKKKYERMLMKRRLVADCCDLFVPGLVVGWIDVGILVMGYAGVVSSLLGLWEIWEKLG